MAPTDAIKQILPAFEQYYTIKNEDVTPPFCAEAEFRSHNEQYFLVRSAHIADIDSNEFIFFGSQIELTPRNLSELCKTAWEAGLSRVKPYNGHRNSDVTLFIFTDTISDPTKKSIKKTKLSRSYKWGFYGWSNFRLAVAELNSKTIYFNRLGKDYRNLLIKNLEW